MLAAGALAAVASLATAGSAAAADPVNPTVTMDGGTYTLVIHSHTTSESFVPKGGTPTAEEPNAAPKVGDGFTFTEELTQNGTLVGHDKGTCTVTGERSASCVVAVPFPNGTLAVEGAPEFTTDDSVPVLFKVVGGTGAYAGAKGTASVKNSNETDSDITVRYTLGGQVSAMPSGGAATGDGSTAAGGTAWLLGIGSLATASGVLLVGGAARRASRSS